MLYIKYLKILIKGQLEYRLSFWITVVGHFFVPMLHFVAMWAMFERFETIAGWTRAEAMLCLGVSSTGLALAECFARGFDMFSALIIKGDFDRIMLRPRGTVVQVLGGDFNVTRLARVAQGLLVTLIALRGMAVQRLGGVVVAMMILCSAVIFAGLFVIGATMCFFTTEGLEVINVFTYGGQRASSYPLTIYPPWLLRFFVLVVPIGCANYLPMMYLTGRAGPLYALTPLAGMLFIAPCLWIWRHGVRHYLSTGS